MAKQRILVVEDTPNNLQLVSEVLQMNGYCVRGATSAEAGIRRAREEVPDLILMDINLPGMDGLEATRILKGLPETKDISIVALTSRAMKGDREKATQAGCSGYITKPVVLLISSQSLLSISKIEKIL